MNMNKAKLAIVLFVLATMLLCCCSTNYTITHPSQGRVSEAAVNGVYWFDEFWNGE